MKKHVLICGAAAMLSAPGLGWAQPSTETGSNYSSNGNSGNSAPAAAPAKAPAPVMTPPQKFATIEPEKVRKLIELGDPCAGASLLRQYSWNAPPEKRDALLAFYQQVQKDFAKIPLVAMEAARGQATLYDKAGETDKAVEVMRAFFADPTTRDAMRVEALKVIASSFMQGQRWEEARTAHQNVVKFNPQQFSPNPTAADLNNFELQVVAATKMSSYSNMAFIGIVLKESPQRAIETLKQGLADMDGWKFSTPMYANLFQTLAQHQRRVGRNEAEAQKSEEMRVAFLTAGRDQAKKAGNSDSWNVFLCMALAQLGESYLRTNSLDKAREASAKARELVVAMPVVNQASSARSVELLETKIGLGAPA